MIISTLVKRKKKYEKWNVGPCKLTKITFPSPKDALHANICGNWLSGFGEDFWKSSIYLNRFNKLESPLPKDVFCLVWWNLVLSFWRRRLGKVVSVFSLFLISSNWKSVVPQIHLNISFFVLKTGYQYIPVFAYKQINMFIEWRFRIYCQCWTINIYCVPDEKKLLKTRFSGGFHDR